MLSAELNVSLKLLALYDNNQIDKDKYLKKVKKA
jgi:hypothetical protein